MPENLHRVTFATLAFFAITAGVFAQKPDDSGNVDDYNQWKQALGSEGAVDATLVSAASGFEVELIRSAAADEGSWISLVFDPKGRILLSREDQGILRLTLPDEPGGSQRLETINDTLQECRGLLFVGDTLLASANNSKGLYRLRDTSGDDHFDEVKLLREMPGNVGHGRNDLALGPDGLVYLICGNDVRLPQDFQPAASPYRNYEVDRLLPCQWNDSLFNFGVLPPAGHLIRTDIDGKRWEVIAGGFRNPYGIDFNLHGEMFTFDADMEWEAGLPWYRPCRVNHIISGADYGWRQGIGKWAAWYPDSLPATFDIGLASPTAVKFGTRSNFPARYRDALFILDWAYGRILAVDLLPSGASYQGRAETFLKGRPLNVTDLDFGPDGAMYFTTGGRKTQSGLYRVRYVADREPSDEFRLEEALPGVAMLEILRQTRRQLEAFHGRVDPAAVETAWEYLDSSDLWILHAARIAIESQPVDTWADRALREEKPVAGLTALLALTRVGSPAQQAPVIERLAHFAAQDLNAYQQVLLLRTYSLAFLRLGAPTAQQRADVAEIVARRIPSEISPVNQLAAELLVYLNDPTAPSRVLALLQQAKTQEEKIHYLYVLSQAATGWTTATRRQFLLYLREADQYHGARYVPQVIGHIRDDVGKQLSQVELEQFAELLAPAIEPEPNETEPTASSSAEQRPLVRRWELDDLVGSLGEVNLGRDLRNGQQMFEVAQCSACHKSGQDGGLLGPDLTSVARRFGRHDILDSILNPSKVVDDKYRSTVIVTKSGSVHTGLLLGSGADSLQLAANPLQPGIKIRIARNDIETQQYSLVSPMPRGTLDRLAKDDILDLLAYLESLSSEN